MNVLDFNNENLKNAWDYENGFYLSSKPNRLNKLIAHYELYKKIVQLPGDILEFGVYKGASLIRFASFRNLLENSDSRKIIGFDAFGKFPVSDNAQDNKFIENFENQGGDGINKENLELFLDMKGFKNNTLLVKGNIFDTLNNYLLENPHTKVSLLHIDVDVYDATSFVIKTLYDRVVKGGIIIFDDYNAVAGATRAIDEFLADKPEKIQKLNCCYIPSFIEKL